MEKQCACYGCKRNPNYHEARVSSGFIDGRRVFKLDAKGYQLVPGPVAKASEPTDHKKDVAVGMGVYIDHIGRKYMWANNPMTGVKYKRYIFR
jgi:hypothetical protein